MPGGFTQPKPPPSTIAAEVASHSRCKSSSVISVTRSTRHCGGSGGASSAIASGRPAQEVAENADADLLALLDVKLRAGPIAFGHHRHNRSAVVGHGDGFPRIAADQGVAVNEVHVVARRQAIK